MMSTTVKSVIFLAITFAVTWGIVIGGWSAGWHNDPQRAFYVLTLSMFGPAIAALICSTAFEKGRRLGALGLRFKPNWWWLLAWLFPVLIASGSVALTIALSPHGLVDPGSAAIALAEARSPQAAEQARAIPFLGVIVLVQALLLGALVNGVILTISEELGWRGYLYDLWRGAGFWRSSLATGAFWGIWHAPMIYLFGHNYPDHRLLGVGLFTVFCMILSPMMTLVRDRGQSVWAAGVFHGTFNALGGLTVLMVGNAAFPWNGAVGIGGFIALAIGFAVVVVLQRGGTPPDAVPAQA
ncbi:MAG: CPBP family intramembrane metalloprotease [Phycisphaerales bacterium]|nr:CPBP family intramembrane metalloprotease [Hyphomonadaceae bacterium]